MTANNTNSTNSSIAIAHKDYDVRGGGEVLAEHLADTFNAPLYVGHRNTDNEPDHLEPIEIPLTGWQRRFIQRGGATRSLAYWVAWQNADALNDYDVVITSGNEPLWHVGPDHQVKIAYTHSTPRWQYDLAHKTGSGVVGTGYRTAVRTIYQHNITRPDLWIANSDSVARRIQKYFDIRDNEQLRVVYPPVETHAFSPEDATTGDYYLYLGRLADHKRVNEVVEAFNYTDHHLKIAGKGPEKQALERQANGNIQFKGYVDEDEKQRLYSEAKALVYPPLNEDFGMVPIEAMSAGTPVIGVNDGFTKHQIKDGKNGILWDRSTPDLHDAVQRFEAGGVEWSEHELADWAREWFGVQRFKQDMQQAVRDARQHASVEPPWKHQHQQQQGQESEGARRPLTADGGEPWD